MVSLVAPLDVKVEVGPSNGLSNAIVGGRSSPEYRFVRFMVVLEADLLNECQMLCGIYHSCHGGQRVRRWTLRRIDGARSSERELSKPSHNCYAVEV